MELQGDVKMVMLGDNTELTFTFNNLIFNAEGTKFLIREDGKIAGAGLVFKILK